MSEDARGARSAARRAAEARVVELAARQHGVVTRGQLLDVGLTSDTIDRRVLDGRLRRLHLGVFGVGALLPPRASLMAAVLACGERAVVSHRTAAALFGLLEAPSTAPIEVSVPLPGDRRRSGVRIHRVVRLDDDERVARDGIPVTSPTRTLADLAAVLDERNLERVIARAEREGIASPDQIDEMRLRYASRPGAARLHAVIGRAGGPGLTRSEAEARFLRLVRRARLPIPRVNVAHGGYEIDFLWADVGLAVEIDGFRFHGSRASFESDRRRIAHLASLGIQVIPLTWRQVVEDEVATVAQLAQALAIRGRPVG